MEFSGNEVHSSYAGFVSGPRSGRVVRLSDIQWTVSSLYVYSVVYGIQSLHHHN